MGQPIAFVTASFICLMTSEIVGAHSVRPYILNRRKDIAFPQNFLPPMRANRDEIRTVLGVIIRRQAVNLAPCQFTRATLLLGAPCFLR